MRGNQRPSERDKVIAKDRVYILFKNVLAIGFTIARTKFAISVLAELDAKLTS